MPVDRAALDETMRRFPAIVRCWPSLWFFISDAEMAAIHREYRLVLAERTKDRKTA